jgi:hypothetical protein
MSYRLRGEKFAGQSLIFLDSDREILYLSNREKKMDCSARLGPQIKK